ncbi:BTB/POZ domain family protein [Clavispora lusitaniae]|uniref:BTB/POZ domain family protein n=1 Tax=Clavispora lusitaniae TaxID=36911 RepID=UPI00202BCDB3|nr:BTB/POZ domain family protein [Clavispora lusitaniae]
MSFLAMSSGPTSGQNSSAVAPDVSSVDLEKAFQDLLLACRAGDSDTVDSLTSIPHLDINQVDRWDYSPLILASICGHLKIVELLLARGAVCDRDTFQGARCIYGALTDEIRSVLLSYDITKAVDDKQPFLAHIAQLVSPTFSLVSARDLALRFGPDVLLVNRFVLAARSMYWAAQLGPVGEWHDKTVLEFPEEDLEAFRAATDYIYLRTDRLESFPAEVVSLAEKWGLVLESAQPLLVSQAKDDMRRFLLDHVRANAYEHVLDDSDLEDAADGEIDYEEIDAEKLLSPACKTRLLRSSALPDALLSFIDVEAGSVVYYPVHRAILSRSDFYAQMFKSQLFQASGAALPSIDVCGEAVVDRVNLENAHVPVLQSFVSCTQRSVVEAVLQYLYHDEVTHISPEVGVELLYVAEELHIERLKTMSAVVLTSLAGNFDYAGLENISASTGYSACELVEVAWDTRSERLEQHMAKLLAHNIERICEDTEMRAQVVSLIRKSAQRILSRHDTDTIELVDDMRYYLAKKYAVYDEFAGLDGVGRSLNPAIGEAEDIRAFSAALADHDHDIAVIDGLLAELGLEA